MKTIPNIMLCHIAGGRATVVDAATSDGLTRVETGAAIAAIGGGVGASYAIQGAGSIALLGTAAPGIVAAGGAGVYASWEVGQAVGTGLYNNVGFVRDSAQAVVGYGFDLAGAASNYYEGIGAHGCGYAPGNSPFDMDADYEMGR